MDKSSQNNRTFPEKETISTPNVFPGFPHQPYSHPPAFYSHLQLHYFPPVVYPQAPHPSLPNYSFPNQNYFPPFMHNPPPQLHPSFNMPWMPQHHHSIRNQMVQNGVPPQNTHMMGVMPEGNKFQPHRAMMPTDYFV